MPTRFYDPRTADGAYHLRYAWFGWPSGKEFSQQPSALIDETKAAWERDGIRVLERLWTAKCVRILFSCTPEVSPEFVAARAKGRLDHALRTAEMTMAFSRKVGVRAVGDNTRSEVEAYIAGQVRKECFVDPRFAAKMEELTVVDQSVDLSQPATSARGRYWYNLHVVLVVAERTPLYELSVLRRVRDAVFKVAAKKGHVVSRLSVMPDHLHVTLRGRSSETPLEIVFAYQNNLAHMAGRGRLWAPGFYVGTFGEYTLQAVRKRILRG